MKAEPSIKVIGKVGQILVVFRDRGPELQLQDIAAASGLDVSTTSRLVNSLVLIGLLRFDSVQRLYAPGLLLLELSRSVVNRFDFRELVHRELLAVATSSGWACYLGVMSEDSKGHVVYLDVIDAHPHPHAHTQVGQRLPAHTTTSGKVLLAFGHIDPLEIELPQRTARSHTNRDQLRAELEEVRVRGYSITEGEEEAGVYCVGAPIFDSTGTAIAAVGFSTEERSWEQEREAMIAHVVGKANGFSAALGLGDLGLVRLAGA
jgi:DNA-binding IclR family transcriptional regulator